MPDVPHAAHRRSAAALAACALALAVTTAGPVHAGRQTVIEGPLTIGSLTVQTMKFHVPGDWMRHPRLEGRLAASGGSGNDIEVTVLRDADLPAWEKRQPVTPLRAVERATTFDLSLPLPGPGAYVVVLSNKFSKFSSKRVTGSLDLVWDEDPSLPSGAALRAQVRFVDLPDPPVPLTVAVHAADSAAVVRFQKLGEDEHSGFAVTVARREGAATVVRTVGRYPGRIEEVGTVDLHGDGDRDVFLVGTATDSTGPRLDLMVICPRQFGMLGVWSVAGRDSVGSPAHWRYGETFADPRFVTEQSFLERIKSAYAAAGVARPAERGGRASPLFGAWLRDNGAIGGGPMTIRRLPGPAAEGGRVTARLEDGAVTYTARESSGVVADDRAAGEHYALFHPRDRRAWPTVLLRAGRWLAIGTRGEGVALVDLGTFRLERLHPGGAADTVRALEAKGDSLRVNGGRVIALPRE